MSNTIDKIMFVVHGLPPEKRGGTENYTWALARQVNKYKKTIIFTRMCDKRYNEYDIRKDVIDSIPIYRINNHNMEKEYYYHYNNIYIDNKFIQVMEEEKPNIIHIIYSLGGLSAGIIIEASKKAGTIVTITDMHYLCAWGQLIRPDLKLCDGPKGGWECCQCFWGEDPMTGLSIYKKSVVKMMAPENRSKYCEATGVKEMSRRLKYNVDALNSSSLVISPTQGIMRKHKENGVINIKELGFGIEDQCDVKERQIGENITFGFIGQLLPHKGLHIVAEALDTGKFDYEFSVKVYGEIRGIQEREYLDNAIKLGADKIDYLGTFEPNEISEILSRFDVLLFPSMWMENSPLVVLTALQCGIPVIASEIEGVEGLVTNKTGWLFERGNVKELNNIIINILSSPEIINKKRGLKGKIKTIKDNAGELVEIYQEVLDG